MAITIIRAAPEASSYTPLEDFQATTPESLTEVEVLHYSSPVTLTFTPSTASPFQSSTVTVYVTSKIFTVWSETESKGITIPYPNISLHAIQAAGSRNPDAPGCIYMQLEGASHLTHEPGTNGQAHDSYDNDEDDTSELVEIHLTPSNESTLPAFYETLCACATLHPDPSTAEDDIFDENHQWITADNFNDADGDEPDGNISKWRKTE